MTTLHLGPPPTCDPSKVKKVLVPEVPQIVQLVFNTELLTISSMSEGRSEHKACFGASLKIHRVLSSKKSPKECGLPPPPPPPPSAEKVTLSSSFLEPFLYVGAILCQY